MCTRPLEEADVACFGCRYVHLGSLAYLGMNRAVMQLPPPFPATSLKGVLAAEVWRALELMMQVQYSTLVLYRTGSDSSYYCHGMCVASPHNAG